MLFWSILLFFGIPIIAIIIGIILYRNDLFAGPMICGIFIGILLLVFLSFMCSNIQIKNTIYRAKYSSYDWYKTDIKIAQEWNKTIFTVFIPDDVDSIE